MQTGEDDPAVAAAIADLGANVLATLSPPNAKTAAAAASAGVGYLPRLSLEDVDRLATDGTCLTVVREPAESRGLPVHRSRRDGRVCDAAGPAARPTPS